MTHWGWYWKVKKKHVAKAVCDYKQFIDSFEIMRMPDFAGFTAKSSDGRELKAVLLDGRLKLSVEDFEYFVPIEKQVCHYGGYRHFFRCPVPSCQARMRKLYLSWPLLACRKCLKLGYRCQAVVPSHRFWLMEKKVEKKLEGKGGSVYNRPKGMHRKTFERLRRKASEYCWKSECALEDEILKMYGDQSWFI